MPKKMSIKLSNQLRIINLLREEGPLSRKVIADKLNVTRASITQLTNELMELGMVAEKGEAQETQSRAGRKEILLDLQEDYWYLLGIDIEVDSVSVGIVTTRGRTLAKNDFNFDVLDMKEDTFERFSEKLLSVIEATIQQSEIALSKILYGGIGMVGRTAYYRLHKMTIPPILKNRRALGELVQEKFNLPMALENNVRALAAAESQFFPETNRESYLFIKFGPGLGSAMFFNNTLYRGVNEQAGEIGRSIVSEFYPEFAELHPLSLETVISISFIQKELAKYWNDVQLPYLYDRVNGKLEDLSMPVIYDALTMGEMIIVRLYKKKMKILAQKIYNYKNMLDLDRIYLFFSTYVSQILYEYLIEELKQLSEELAEQTKLSRISIDASYLGGAGIAYIEGIENLEKL